MGATSFRVTTRGDTAKAAFRTAVEDAQYESGHGGYTGTIAEKNEFREIAPPAGMTGAAFVNLAERVADGENAPDDVPEGCRRAVGRAAGMLNDKWAPCLCVPVGNGSFIFAGLASS